MYFNIFQGLSTAEYRKVMLVVEQAILSTDLALYFRKKDIFLETANAGEIDWQEKEKKDCELNGASTGYKLTHLVGGEIFSPILLEPNQCVQQ